LGYSFEQELSTMNLPLENIMNLKATCVEFIKNLLVELIKRMPTHLDDFRKIKCFSPKIILNHKRPKFSELPLQFVNTTAISDLEFQYRNNMNWNDVFEGHIPDDAQTFKLLTTFENQLFHTTYHKSRTHAKSV
jgi:hypothetical protein